MYQRTILPRLLLVSLLSVVAPAVAPAEEIQGKS
jgi:hypothetical protein